MDFKEDIAYLCKVTTHIQGVHYGPNKNTVDRIRKKHNRQIKYEEEYLDNFNSVRFMFWSPVVPVGYITEHLSQISGLELIINGKY